MSKSIISKIKLLVVIAIVGVFVWIFILSPMLTFKSNEKKLEDAARRYYELNSNLLPTGERIGTVTLETLYNKSYIDKDLFIPLTKKTCSVTNSWVKVRRENGDYKYYTYLECGVLSSTIDHKGPEIKLNGDSDITLNVGDKFEDPGIKSVVDNKDGKLNVKDVEIKGSVDTSSVGTFEIKYIARDKFNNSTTVVRKVEVVQRLNGLVKTTTSGVGYYTGSTPSNYIYFSNMVFRIVGLEGKNVKIVADKDIANVNYNGIEEWFKYYEKHLTDSSKKLIVKSKFCNMAVGNDPLNVKECTSYSDKKKFGLLSIDEINRANAEDGNYLYLNTISWTNNTINKKSSYSYRRFFFESNKRYMDFENVHNLGVRPVIVIDGDVMVKDGNGSYNKPYKLDDYIEPKKHVEVNTRYPGEYIRFSGMLWRIVEVENDGTTKIMSEESLYENSKLYVTTYKSLDAGKRVYNPSQKGNVGYTINNVGSKFFDTKYLVNHEIEVPIYKSEPNYGKEKEVKKYTVKISSPNMYEMFSASNDNPLISSYWFLNSSLNENENPGMSEIGAVMYGEGSPFYKYGVRPVVYLNSKCLVSSGKGTEKNPYVITK